MCTVHIPTLQKTAMTTDKVYRSELTPVDFLRRSARVYAHKIAVVHGTRRYTYAQFSERVARLASGLLAKGFTTGDRVAILSPNTPALLEAHFAIPALGGVLVPINTAYKTEKSTISSPTPVRVSSLSTKPSTHKSPTSNSVGCKSSALPTPAETMIPTRNFSPPRHPTHCHALLRTKRLLSR